jgi:hypothetical protein
LPQLAFEPVPVGQCSGERWDRFGAHRWFTEDEIRRPYSAIVSRVRCRDALARLDGEFDEMQESPLWKLKQMARDANV